MKKLGSQCACGFEFRTPHGMDDAVAVVELHLQRVHKKEFPRGMQRHEIEKQIKEL